MSSNEIVLFTAGRFNKVKCKWGQVFTFGSKLTEIAL